jgi:hypothetical protein
MDLPQSPPVVCVRRRFLCRDLCPG